MIEQFFGNVTKNTYLALLGATVLGVFVWRVDSLSLPMLIAIAVLGSVLYLKNPSWALAAVFAEVFSFSHGRLVYVSIDGVQITSRMALFLGIMVGWCIRVAQRRITVPKLDAIHIPWILLLCGIALGTWVGFMDNDAKNVVEDANGYLFMGYLLPIFTHAWGRDDKRILLQSLFGALLWVSTLTLASLYIFTHLPNEAITATYKFLRDARIAEITQMDGGLWRIFIPSQMGLLMGGFLLLWFRSQEGKAHRGVFIGVVAMMLAALLTSLSRSFAVGVLAALVVGGGLWTYQWRQTYKGVVWESAIAIAASVALVVVIALLPFPYPSRVSDISRPFSSRSTDLSDAAISSRWNLLPVMWNEVVSSPLVGSGFGKVLVFVSDDPRVREVYPDGKWRTFSFEWGWLDLWIKMGVLGVVAFLMIGILYVKNFWQSTEHPFWLRAALLSTIIALYATHIFSPYLNHPIGLSMLLFSTIFLSPSKPITVPLPKLPIPFPQTSMPSAHTRNI